MSHRTGTGPVGRPPELSAAQHRAVTEADPSTGRLAARTSTCAALVAKGLAVAHRRSGHFSHYLSAEGRALRDRLAAEGGRAAEAAERPGEQAAPAPGGAPFRAATGAEVVRAGDHSADTAGGAAAAGGGGGHGGTTRDADLATAWAGLLEIRRLSNDGDTAVPAPWERARPVDAVALALESAGMAPSAVDAPDGRTVREGYRVTASDQPGAVRVAWLGTGAAEAAARSGTATRRLEECSRTLAGRGWQPTRHTDRWGEWFLLVSARRF